MIFRPEEMLGIVDLRLLGYYKIKTGIWQQNLSRYYKFERAEKLCKYFNKFVNALKKEREQKAPEDKYPWLDPNDEWRYMTGKENIRKIHRLRQVMFDQGRKERSYGYAVWNTEMQFSLRDEICTCPNIKVEIDVTDKSPFFIRPYHVREEDKSIYWQGNEGAFPIWKY